MAVPNKVPGGPDGPWMETRDDVTSPPDLRLTDKLANPIPPTGTSPPPNLLSSASYLLNFFFLEVSFWWEREGPKVKGRGMIVKVDGWMTPMLL